jgi:hypothetical protein
MKIILSLLGILGLAVLYYIYISAMQADNIPGQLGTMGDFIGGNVNPILTFITTIILIDSFVVQRKTAKEAKDAEIEARKTVKKQASLAHRQSFESSLFNLISLCLSEYKATEITIKSVTYSGSQAFSKYAEIFEGLMDKVPKACLLNKLEEVSYDALFNTIKNFSTIFKFINENAPKKSKEKYISLILTLMPLNIIQLLCIAKNHSGWPIISNFDTAGIFNRPSLERMILYFK